ncbi:MAG: helix-turn-helix domain containing protein [Candidatus Omnitrophica bacterium]|nr:helix-turn-helix domain containing protein [Candidatus Omnitrophota bacterium]
MSTNNTNESKLKILKKQRVLNARAESVRDEFFKSNDFFDPNDIVQVKYEMLRRVEIEGWSVARASEVFGFSRPTFYKIQKDFKKGGLIGLIPRKGGPKMGHKLSQEVIDFILESIEIKPRWQSPYLAALVTEKFGIKVHPRSIERGVARMGKKRKRRRRVT